MERHRGVNLPHTGGGDPLCTLHEEKDCTARFATGGM